MYRMTILSLVMAVMASNFLSAQETSNRSFDAPIASPSEIAEALKNCNGAIREQDIAICAWNDFRREEVRYRQASKEMSLVLDESGERQALAQANRVFEQFRAATCEFDSARNGRMGTSLLYGCLELYTRRRAGALKAFAKCEKSGDCGLPNLLYIHENEEPPRDKK